MHFSKLALRSAAILAIMLTYSPALLAEEVDAGASKDILTEARSKSFAEGMVSITFDDSWRSQYTSALPVLEAAGVKATFYLTTEPVAKGWRAFLTPMQIMEIATKGHEIAGHTVRHRDLTHLSASALTEELVTSKTYLEKLTGVAVKSFAYPYGRETRKVQSAVETDGYASGRGVYSGLMNAPTTELYSLRSLMPTVLTPISRIKTAIDGAKEKKQWLILTFHLIDSSRTVCSMRPADFEDIVKYLKASGMKTVTVGEGVALMRHLSETRTHS